MRSPSTRRPRLAARRTAGGVLAASAVTSLLLAAQVRQAVSREYLPSDPGYTVDEVVVPAAGADSGSRPVELVALGDSTVAGVGASGVQGSLPVLTAQRVAELSGRPVHVIGYGESGARTDDVRLRQIPLLPPSGLDAVVIVVGSNDVTHVTRFWEMRERTEALLIAAHRRAGAPVVLGGIPEFRTVPALAQPLRAVVGAYASPLRSAQRAAAGSSEPAAPFVDIAALASPRFVGLPESMSADGFHPSPVGYGFWADALAPAVVEAVTRPRGRPR